MEDMLLVLATSFSVFALGNLLMSVWARKKGYRTDENLHLALFLGASVVVIVLALIYKFYYE